MKSPPLFPLIISLGVIVILGLTTILSTYPDLFPNQLTFFLAGILVVILLSRLDHRLLESLAPFLYILALIFLVATFILGSATRGSVRWIDLGPFRFQSSEFSKPLLIAFFASSFNKPIYRYGRWLINQIGLLIPPTALIFLQPDLGSSLVVIAIWFGMLFASRFPTRQLIIFLFIGLLSLPIGFTFLKDYQRQRLHTFISPYSDPGGSGYNVIQAMIAVGSGGILGKGVRQGTQSHLRFLPERHTDFAFASFAEEFGFIGSTLLFVSFLTLLLWLLHLSKHLIAFDRLLITGAFWLFFIQFAINTGMNMGILPVTGITLPLFSYGGSSILSSAIVLGFVLSVRKSKKLD